MASELNNRRVDAHSAELIRRAEISRRAVAGRARADHAAPAGERTRPRLGVAPVTAVLLALFRR